MEIAKIGDEIHWQSYGVPYDNWVKGQRDCVLMGYKAEVVMIDIENKDYGVETFYGNDRIPFDDVTKIIRKT